ncbi:MAG: multiheme c-type cytochrome [Chthoniobacterales bacterium]
MLPRIAILCIFVLTGAPVLPAKEPRQVQETGGIFVGSVGCKSSSCHGGAGEKRSQYFTWSQKDFHTKAFAVLLDSRSERIAESLGIAAAPSSARCTVCHSPLQSVAPTQLAPTAHPDEGVSCETCHGAAGGWLRGHTRKDWTYNTRVGAGMRDLRSIYVRATACAACHQNLAPELLKAGHPDLFFELDSQSVAEPKHWKDDDSWSGVREWLTGQAVALREMSWALASDPHGDEWSNARWNGLAWVCSITANGGGSWPQITQPAVTPALSEFNRARTEADALARQASVSSWNASAVRTLLTVLASKDTEFAGNGTPAPVLGQRAKRLVLALDRLANALNQNRDFKLKVDPELGRLFEDVRTLDPFDAAAFSLHLKAFSEALDKAG